MPHQPQGPPRVADGEHPAGWPSLSLAAVAMAHLRSENFLDCLGRGGQSHGKEVWGPVCIFQIC